MKVKIIKNHRTKSGLKFKEGTTENIDFTTSLELMEAGAIAKAGTIESINRAVQKVEVEQRTGKQDKKKLIKEKSKN